MILQREAAERKLGRKIKAPASKKWFLLSADGSKNLGGYTTKAGAARRERQVQFFKHRKKNPYRQEAESFEYEAERPRQERIVKIRGTPSKTEGADVFQQSPSGLAGPGELAYMLERDPETGQGLGYGAEFIDPGSPIWDEVGDDLFVNVIDARHWGVHIADIEAPDAVHAYEVKYGTYTRPSWDEVRELDPVPMPKAFTKIIIKSALRMHRGTILEEVEGMIREDLNLESRRYNNPRRRKNARKFLDRDHKWDEVLIQKGGKRRTRKQIRDYYLKNQELIWPYLKGQMMMIILAPKKNTFVLRRKGPDGKYIRLTKLKGIDDPKSFEYWINRRVIEFHPVIEPNKKAISKTTTPLVFIDVDPYRTKSKAMNRRMQRRIKDNVMQMKSVLRKEFKAFPIRVWKSGKEDGGWHVEGNLPRAMNVDRVRMRLRSALDDAFAEDKHFVTTIAKPDQIRLDITLLKAHGSLRAPYSYTVDGEQKLPTTVQNPILVPNPPLAGADIGRFKQAVSEGPSRTMQFLMVFPTEELGRGTAEGRWRTAYLIDTDEGMQVLKVDTSDDPEQTRNEIQCLIKSAGNPLVPQLYDHDSKEGRWVQVEQVDGFDHSTIRDMGKYRRIFEKLSGIPWVDFESVMGKKVGQILLNKSNQEMVMDDLGDSDQARKFLKNLFKVMRNCDLIAWEISVFENWGVTLDGKQLKVLDLGQ